MTYTKQLCITQIHAMQDTTLAPLNVTAVQGQDSGCILRTQLNSPLSAAL